ncbi:hypothetical protein ACFL2A_04540 [Thermodesulfobacteriota bacterium]
MAQKRRMQTKGYQILKSDYLSNLREDYGLFHFHLTKKRINRDSYCKASFLRILERFSCRTSFVDVVRHLIEVDDVDSLCTIILSEKVSSSKKALLSGYDCCITCDKNRACSITLQALSHADKVNYLMYLRYVRAKKFMRLLKSGVDASCFRVLIDEPLLLKFMANYALVVDLKNELKKEGRIKGDKTLYKGAGKYCPFDDFYELGSAF